LPGYDCVPGWDAHETAGKELSWCVCQLNWLAWAMMISYMEHWCPWCIMVIVADVCLHFRRGTRFAYFRKIVADLPSKNRFVDGACAEETVGYAVGIWNCIWNIWNLRHMFVQENRILMPMSKRGPPMTPVLCSDHFSCISFVFVCCVCRVSCGSPTRSIPDAEQ
jgi:hypothetical protein